MAADPFPPSGETPLLRWVVAGLVAAVVGLFTWCQKIQSEWRRDQKEHSKEIMETVRTVDRLAEALRLSRGNRDGKQ